MRYDMRNFQDVSPKEIVLTEGQVNRMITENPALTADIISEVVHALNWDTISDPIGMVRVHPSGEVMAIRVPSALYPWHVVWLNGRGGGTSIEQYHTWPEYQPSAADEIEGGR